MGRKSWNERFWRLGNIGVISKVRAFMDLDMVFQNSITSLDGTYGTDFCKKSRFWSYPLNKLNKTFSPATRQYTLLFIDISYIFFVHFSSIFLILSIVSPTSRTLTPSTDRPTHFIVGSIRKRHWGNNSWLIFILLLLSISSSDRSKI